MGGGSPQQGQAMSQATGGQFTPINQNNAQQVGQQAVDQLQRGNRMDAAMLPLEGIFGMADGPGPPQYQPQPSSSPGMLSQQPPPQAAPAPQPLPQSQNWFNPANFNNLPAISRWSRAFL